MLTCLRQRRVCSRTHRHGKVSLLSTSRTCCEPRSHNRRLPSPCINGIFSTNISKDKSNQVSYLQSRFLPAATLNSTLPNTERERIYSDLNCGHPRIRLLYITPELASKAVFRKTLQKIYRNGELNRFVIDEGHCISEWGHDFRKDYRSLSYFRLVWASFVSIDYRISPKCQSWC
jgi:hypothetical protein